MQQGTKANERSVLDLSRKGTRAREFEQQLAQRIVGQDEAVHVLSSLYQVFLANLLPSRRPIGTLLFLGPTGSGKTRAAEAAAEALFGNPQALIKIDCAEFQHAHEIARLVGSPPGYVGHRDTQPLLTQENLDRHHTAENRLTLVVFDEIEKACEALWQLLLGILDRATLTLGDNRTVDFSRVLVIMTSNLGAQEMADRVSGGLGFAPARDAIGDRQERLKRDIQRVGTEAARRRFSPEFMNRIDKTVVFTSLGDQQLRQILDLELQAIQQRLHRQKATGFWFQCSDVAKDVLLKEGTDIRYGARHLRRAIERRIVVPLSNLVATQQVRPGDLVDVDFDAESHELVFSRTPGMVVEYDDVDAPAPGRRKARREHELQAEVARLAVTTALAVTAAVVKMMEAPERRQV